MTMYTAHHRVTPVVAITPQIIVNSCSPENLVSGDIDLKGSNAAAIYVVLGDVDELGGSPVGAAKVETILEHAADDGTGSPGAYAAVALADVVGPTSVSGGVVATSTADQAFVANLSYVGDKRFIRLTLQPTALTNGGQITAFVMKGHPRHAT